jgi:tetratricopeptide (TPR) repeat protein
MVARGFVLSVSLLAGSALAGAQQDHTHTAEAAQAHWRLGSIAFPNSGARAAQAPFLRGVALLHSFGYYDAANAFKAAQKADRNFALAYWMEALTYRHPLWGQEDLGAARAALRRLGSSANARLAKAKTPRERAYGVAVEALFGEAPEIDRVRRFAEAMDEVAEAYPSDLEAAAFAALASLGVWAQLPRNAAAAQVENAIRHAQRVFSANANHPGASHYLIHAYDDPSRAERGLPFARAYAQIAPDAEHALHMPSHIFLQVGLWDDVAASNERAWAASRAWVKNSKLPATRNDWHSLTWLQYAYIQQGRYRAARALIDTVRVVLRGADFGERFTDAVMVGPDLTFKYRVASGDWSPIDLPSAGHQNDGHSPRAVGFTTTMLLEHAIAAAMRGDSTHARALVARVRSRGDSTVAGDYGSMSYTMGLNVANAILARNSGDLTKAIELLQAAGDLEARTSPAGPPYLPPALEMLGNALLQADRPEEAAAAFSKELEIRHNRSESLLGLARARLASGDSKGAIEAYSKLLVNWKHADPDLPDLLEAKGVVEGRIAGSGSARIP